MSGTSADAAYALPPDPCHVSLTECSMRVPEIIAHRGTPREWMENTLPSFERALQQGADGIELDVHVTSDGTVVVHHDATYRDLRVSSQDRLTFAATTAADLRRVRLPSGDAIPTLDEVLDLVATRATVYIEVKAKAMENALVQCLAQHATSRVAVHAFDHRIPVAIRARRPQTVIGFLSASYPLNFNALLLREHVDALWQEAHLIDDALVAAAHAVGTRVIAWTENDAVHARALTAMGVDALCTDTPGVLRTSLWG